MTLDTSSLLPGDVVAALRSFPNRFAAAIDPARFGEPPDQHVAARDAALTAAGPDGRSPLGTLAGVDAITQLADRCVTELTLHGAGAVDWPPQPSQGDATLTSPDVDTLLHHLSTSLDELADRVASLPNASWGSSGTGSTGAPLEVLDLLRDLVRRVAEDLRTIDDALGRSTATD